MVNGPLHAGDITAGKPIYMRSLARACTHFTICKTTRTGIVRRRCPVVKPAVRTASTLKDFRIILQLLHHAWPFTFNARKRVACARSRSRSRRLSSSRFSPLFLPASRRFIRSAEITRDSFPLRREPPPGNLVSRRARNYFALQSVRANDPPPPAPTDNYTENRSSRSPARQLRINRSRGSPR